MPGTRWSRKGWPSPATTAATATAAIARQDLYVAADSVSASVCTAPAAAPPVAPAAPSAPAAGGTDPQFGTCKPAKASGYGPYHQGTDPEYNWYRDADSDGIVCE